MPLRRGPPAPARSAGSQERVRHLSKWMPDPDEIRADNRPGLLAKSWQVPVFTPTSKAGVKPKQRVYGKSGTLQIAEFTPGYHSKPHKHDNEQINYILEGEIWMFVDDQGFRCERGDFQRVPQNAIHWAVVRADEPCVMMEMHSPPMMYRTNGRGAELVALLGPDEVDDVVGIGVSEHIVDYDYEAVERKYFGE